MPVFRFFDPVAEAAKAKAIASLWCNGFYLLDGEPYETGPEWVWVGNKSETLEETTGCHYLSCTNLRTGKVIQVTLDGIRRFKEVERLNAMEVLAYAAKNP